MSHTVISAEKLGKEYVIGGRQNGHDTFREMIVSAAATPFRRLRRLSGKVVPEERIWALRDVSFEVKEGEVVGIIGRNGAGKSTLLKILSRITTPTEGRVEIRGSVSSLLEVGTGFHPELTGRENIYLNGAILGMGRLDIDRKFDGIVDFSGVEKFLDTPVKRYSSGMAVRLAFAVAAYLEPEILIVDEVLAVGDAEFQKKCLGKMGDVARSGRTVLFVSHNMNAIERLCRSVIVLDGGCNMGIYNDVRQAILTYLRGIGVGKPSDSILWENLRGEFINDYFFPERFELLTCARQDEPFSNQHPIEVLVTGVVRQADSALNVGIGLYSGDGELLFWSFTTDEVEERWPKLEAGPVRLRMRIPARLLNEGDYRIELLASLHHRAWLLHPNTNAPCLSFSVQGGLSDSPLWDHKRPGVFAPVLTWENVEGRKTSSFQ